MTSRLDEIRQKVQQRAAELKADLEAKKPRPKPKHERPAISMHPDELRAVRESKEWTQEQMAHHLKCSLRTYKRDEKNGIPLRARLRAAEVRKLRPKRPSLLEN